MLRRARDLEGLTVSAVDGHAGRIKDIYFDDQRWEVRYLIADTSPWPTGIHVAIRPGHITEVDVRLNAVVLDQTRLEIERNPVLESERPVSAQLREGGVARLVAPMYWGFTPAGATGSASPTGADASAGTASFGESLRAPHLRSARHVTGFRVQATDGQLGHVIDVMVDDTDWTIPYLMTDTTHWRPGRPRLISTACVERIEVGKPQVLTRVSREEAASSVRPAAIDQPDLPEVAGECSG
jgi:hypothetical protein